MSGKKDNLGDLVRTLNLIPYFQSHPDQTLFEAARDLGMDYGQLVEAINRLHTSGTSMFTEDLVDLTKERTTVKITEDQGLGVVLRLSPMEAGALLLALESLEAISGLTDRDAVVSAADKIRAIMPADSAAVVDVTPPHQPNSNYDVVASALGNRHRLRLTYSGRERVIDPVRIFTKDQFTYLAAWQDGEERTFRVDRIEAAAELDEKATSKQIDIDPADPFSFGRSADIVIESEATWLADYYAIELREVREDGRVDATLAYGSDDWLVKFCVQQADRVTLISPETLTSQVAASARRGLDGYGY